MNNPTSKRKIGDIGEKLAANYLKSKGYKILEMNYSNTSGRQLGEIDIIAKDLKSDDIVFVEVKTRDRIKYGQTLPEENITYPKLRRLERISNAYLNQKKLFHCGYRFDAISVLIDEAFPEKSEIKHIICL